MIMVGPVIIKDDGSSYWRRFSSFNDNPDYTIEMRKCGSCGSTSQRVPSAGGDRCPVCGKPPEHMHGGFAIVMCSCGAKLGIIDCGHVVNPVAFAVAYSKAMQAMLFEDDII